MGLGEKGFSESVDEMRHADQLIDRILFLEGLPDLRQLNKLLIGETVEEVLQCDLKLENDAQAVLREAIAYCESSGEYVSRKLFEKILKDEEGHIDWLETQLDLIEKFGVQNYQQSQM